MPVIGLAHKRPYLRDDISSLLSHYDYSYLVPKRVLLVRFPFTDTPHEGFVQAVYLVFVVRLLVYHPPV